MTRANRQYGERRPGAAVAAHSWSGCRLFRWLLYLPMFLALAGGMCRAGDATLDAQTTAAIQSRLEHAKVLKHGDVQVTSAAGVATLTGTVDDLAVKLDAEKAARKAPGVSQVLDNIQVNTNGVGEQQNAGASAPRDRDVLGLWVSSITLRCRPMATGWPSTDKSHSPLKRTILASF